MAEELGKLVKPEAEQFKAKRKLYLVPLLFSWEDESEEYGEKFNLYWRQVGEHIANLESKIGKVNRVYHETITVAGEEGLKVIEKLNPSACEIIREKCQCGAEFEASEDAGLVEESMDWERHLMMGFMSQKVGKIIADFFIEASRKRFEYITSRINETLKENEVAMLIIREGHMVQFPADIEVFSVAPPVLDDIHRWLRDRSSAQKEDEPQTGA